MMKNNLSLETWYDDADDLALGEVIKDPTVVAGKTLKEFKAYVDALILKEGEDCVLFDARFDEDGCEITLVREEQKEEEETL